MLPSSRSALAASVRRLHGWNGSAQHALLRARLTFSGRCHSTAAPRPEQKRSNAPLAFALGSVLSGALGYYLATSASDEATQHNSASADLSSNYGSPEDFKKAIEELKQTFPQQDTVTTEAEDLEVHGFSENDYHPSWFHPLEVVLDRSS